MSSRKATAGPVRISMDCCLVLITSYGVYTSKGNKILRAYARTGSGRCHVTTWYVWIREFISKSVDCISLLIKMWFSFQLSIKWRPCSLRTRLHGILDTSCRKNDYFFELWLYIACLFENTDEKTQTKRPFHWRCWIFWLDFSLSLDLEFVWLLSGSTMVSWAIMNGKKNRQKKKVTLVHALGFFVYMVFQ